MFAQLFKSWPPEAGFPYYAKHKNAKASEAPLVAGRIMQYPTSKSATIIRIVALLLAVDSRQRAQGEG